MKLIFESKVPCLLRLNGEYLGEVNEVPRCAEIECTHAFLECQPLREDYLPFCTKLRLRRSEETVCGQLRLIVWNSSVCTVVLCPEKRRPRRPLAALAQVEHEDVVYTLCDDGSCYLLAESREKMTVLPIDFEILSGRLEMVGCGDRTLLQLSASGQRECYYGLYLPGCSCTPVFEGIGDSITLEGEFIRIKKTCRDAAGCKVLARWEIGPNGAGFAGQTVESCNESTLKNLPEHLIPYVFLEAVAQQTDLWKRFLEEELAGIFTMENAQDYFGEFLEARLSPVEFRPGVVALVYEERPNLLRVRHFEFEVRHRKICNINEWQA